jgi:hypothetical protein
MYSPDRYGNTSFVVFPYFPSVEMTADNPEIANLNLANMMDYVACCPGRRLAPPYIANFWKVERFVTGKPPHFIQGCQLVAINYVWRNSWRHPDHPC